jgi:hypothetical protein
MQAEVRKKIFFLTLAAFENGVGCTPQFRFTFAVFTRHNNNSSSFVL